MKKTFQFFTLLLISAFILSCGSNKKNGKPENNDNFDFKIGDFYGGGIIFYIDSSGKHGLIAARIDQSTDSKWGCDGKDIQGTKPDIGSGQPNTVAIVSNCTTQGIAAKLCYELTLDGYDDWYLPSKEELNQIFVNLKQRNIGGLSNSRYWSSTQDNINFVWIQNFSTLDQNSGFQDGGRKEEVSSIRVRAIRSF